MSGLEWKLAASPDAHVLPQRGQIADASGLGEGWVEAVFCTLNTEDRDHDIIVPGAIPEGASVVLSSWDHNSVEGSLPVGRGTVHTVGTKAIFRGKFFMDTQAGRDAYAIVKSLGELAGWSFGYAVQDAEPDRQGRRVIRALTPYEVSPVVVAAGIDTGTLSMKSAHVTGDYGDVARWARNREEERHGGKQPSPREVQRNMQENYLNREDLEEEKAEEMAPTQKPEDEKPEVEGKAEGGSADLDAVVQRIVAELGRLRALLAKEDAAETSPDSEVEDTKYDTDDYNKYQREYQANLSSSQRRDRYESQQKYVEDNVRA